MIAGRGTAGRGVAPTTAQERYEFLDVLRGLALAGIVLANMVSLSLYLYLSESERASLSTASTDRVFDFLELMLIEAKFYTIFSVLFGIGFSILIIRSEAKGMVFRRFFLRRAAFLYLIGIAHAVLFWHNDILQYYALCGVLLLPFESARDRTVLAAASVALVVLPLVLGVWEVLPGGTFLGPRQVLFDRFGFTPDARGVIWSAGSLRSIVLLNASSWFGQFDYVITSGMIFKIYGCFLLGLYIGRNEFHKHLSRLTPRLKRVAALGVGIGLPLNVVYAGSYGSESPLHAVVSTVAILPLSAGYACLLAWLWTVAAGPLVQTFAPVGRMALTNYIGQSVICALIFRGVGLGLGGTMGPTLYLPLGLGIYVVQLAVSRAWLGRFQYGPLEWLWRMLTYGAVIPLRKSMPVPTT